MNSEKHIYIYILFLNSNAQSDFGLLKPMIVL